MILVITGTKDGREITQLLVKEGYQVANLVLTEYGRELALADGAKKVLVAETNQVQIEQLMRGGTIKAVVDVSPPYNENSLALIKAQITNLAVPYVRYERESSQFKVNNLLHFVDSYQEAANLGGKLGNNIFLTTGSNYLEEFINHSALVGKRIVVRVLPEHRIIKKCQDLGISPKNIVAMQGPFSTQLNKVIFRTYKAQVVITKDSGKAGGLDNKLNAALELQIPVIIIRRPRNMFTNQVYDYQGIVSFLSNIQKAKEE